MIPQNPSNPGKKRHKPTKPPSKKVQAPEPDLSLIDTAILWVELAARYDAALFVGSRTRIQTEDHSLSDIVVQSNAPLVTALGLARHADYYLGAGPFARGFEAHQEESNDDEIGES